MRERLMFLRTMVSVLISYLWLSITQWYYSVIVKHPKNIDRGASPILSNQSYTVSFLLHGQKYTMVMKYRKGPPEVCMILDSENNDITDTIYPYMGPNEDWFGSEFNPAYWNENKLKFILYDGTEREFNRYEIISGL